MVGTFWIEWSRKTSLRGVTFKLRVSSFQVDCAGLKEQASGDHESGICLASGRNTKR